MNVRGDAKYICICVFEPRKRTRPKERKREKERLKKCEV